MPERIQLRRSRGWRMPPNTVKVCRPGRWGNPFGIEGTSAEFIVGSVEEAVLLFGLKLKAGELDISVEDVKRELRGKNLACWCRLTDDRGDPMPCHGKTLLEIANG